MKGKIKLSSKCQNLSGHKMDEIFVMRNNKHFDRIIPSNPWYFFEVGST